MKVFEPTTLGKLTLRNKFIHSPTAEGSSELNGFSGDASIAFNRLLSTGVGMHIVGNSYVHESGKHLRGQCGVHSDEMLPGLERLAKAIQNEGAKAAIQISHSGVHGNRNVSGYESMGPSAMVNVKGGQAREMSIGEIEELISWYVAAAKRVYKAGFDAVEIHAAHGYLVGAFLSPHYNKRTDRYGGSVENRSRLLVEIIQGIKRECPDFTVLTKMSCQDGIEGGITHEMMIESAGYVSAAGIDAIEMSHGCNADGGPKWISCKPQNPKTPEEEGYYVDAAKKFKAAITQTPLILVGGIRTPEGAERIIQSGLADFVSLSRPMIREPDLVKRWVEGDHSRAKCVSCNLCMTLLNHEKDILHCIVEKRMNQT